MSMSVYCVCASQRLRVTSWAECEESTHAFSAFSWQTSPGPGLPPPLPLRGCQGTCMEKLQACMGSPNQPVLLYSSSPGSPSSSCPSVHVMTSLMSLSLQLSLILTLEEAERRAREERGLHLGNEWFSGKM